jgi:hypothetical protein
MTQKAKDASKRQREIVAEEASAREFQRRRHNLQVQFNRGRREAAAAPPDATTPTSELATGATDLQQASAVLLSTLTPALVSDLQDEIDTASGSFTHEDEENFLNALIPPLASNSTSQPP